MLVSKTKDFGANNYFQSVLPRLHCIPWRQAQSVKCDGGEKSGRTLAVSMSY